MIFWQVISDDYEAGAHFYATKKEAMTEARAIVKNNGHAAVYRVGLKDTAKASILALANQEGWASIQEKVFDQ